MSVFNQQNSMLQITHRTAYLKETRLAGLAVRLSLDQNTTAALWQRFMPRLGEIEGRLNDDLLSLSIYPPHYFRDFDFATFFEKIAAVEINPSVSLPEAMSEIILPAGLYVVFDYRGSSNDNNIFQYIFAHWLPTSVYEIDDRPHFEVLGANYKNDDPESEEEIWIPVRLKAGE